MTAFADAYTDAPETKTAFDTGRQIDNIDLIELRIVEMPSLFAGFFQADTKPVADDWNRAILELAAEYGREVSFVYEDANGQQKFRVAEPQSVEATDGGAVVTYADTESGPRCFRLDRIKGEVSVRPAL